MFTIVRLELHFKHELFSFFTPVMAWSGKIRHPDTWVQCFVINLIIFQVDIDPNFKTKAILCMPIKNAHGKVIGVTQLINKLDGSIFNKNDENLFEVLIPRKSHLFFKDLLRKYISSRMGNSMFRKLQEERCFFTFKTQNPSYRKMSGIFTARYRYDLECSWNWKILFNQPDQFSWSKSS